MDLDQYDDSQSDSGVSVDFSPNSMSDSETPIEREIRLTFRREQSLRRSRGLDETKVFVEIPIRKPILSQGLTEKPLKDHSKERQFAGKKMQREIHVETEREKALVKLGRLPGFYDKGTVRQLQEKKLLFEAFPESKDLQISSDRTQEPTNRLEMLFHNHSTNQPTMTSPKDLQSARNYNHGTLKTAQEPKNERTSSIPLSKITNGRNVEMDKPDFSSKIHTKPLGLDSSPQLFPSLKEKKLLFESFQDNKDVQISKDQDREVSESFKEQRKSLDIFFQNQNSALKDLQEPKDLQIKRNQDDKISKRNMQVQNSKPCGPGFSEAVDRQVVIIENSRTVSSHTNGQVSTPEAVTDSVNVRSLTAKPRPNSQVQNQTADGEELKENPFFKLRSLPSRLPDVRKDIQETKRREEDLRKQRMVLYGNRSKVTGSQSGTTPTHTVTDTPGQHMNVTPVSSSFGKLDLSGPLSRQPLQNGHKTREVKEQKQTLLLVQRWETGLINTHSDKHHT
ncbi:uncharacterized protein misp3 [Clarias gariepinus]|uniref:uncharacterized protein misp3 n=1 Tax=Clarias gariepinus TaxID=13013 RepID=UPI00234D9A94|nr:uncharacterized protein misp3 [Clarias gariepinus]